MPRASATVLLRERPVRPEVPAVLQGEVTDRSESISEPVIIESGKNLPGMGRNVATLTAFRPFFVVIRVEMLV